MDTKFYAYTSTQADWDPVKTIFLCPPAESCTTVEDAEQYAITSGWKSIAETQKCLLVVPLAALGWKSLPEDHLITLYNQIKNGVQSKQAKSVWGRGGTLWCWEIILFAVGYEDGAEFVSRVQLAYPSFLAAAALVNGCAVDTSVGQMPSKHLLLPKVSEDYCQRNCDIPVQTWIYTGEAEKARLLAEYLERVNHADVFADEEVDGFVCTLAASSKNPAQHVRTFLGTFQPEPQLAQHISQNCFNHVVRWKNGPDGTLAQVPSREEFYNDLANIRRTVGNNGNYYDYFVHLPAGKTVEQVRGLPLVVSLHGRGEPAWMYSNKNGWETLADETGAFVTLTPDSPGNIWFRTRDAEVFPEMIENTLKEFGLDPERVYLTGFSNGGTMTRELSFVYPGLFAAISPWNGPGMDTCAMLGKDTSRLPNCILPELQRLVDNVRKEEWQIPVFMYYGDRDMGIDLTGNLLLPAYLQTNGCAMIPDESCPVGYHPDCEETFEGKYSELSDGDRFHSYLFHGKDGNPMVGVTVMKNMPHGAICPQSRVAWEFLRHFRRPTGSKSVRFE